MKTVYIADDGKEFDNEFDCMDYEWKSKHTNLNTVGFYDMNSRIVDKIFTEEAYGATERVIVMTDAALKDLHAFADYTGFCAYKTITDIGEWVYSEKKIKFEKTDAKIEDLHIEILNKDNEICDNESSEQRLKRNLCVMNNTDNISELNLTYERTHEILTSIFDENYKRIRNNMRFKV